MRRCSTKYQNDIDMIAAALLECGRLDVSIEALVGGTWISPRRPDHLLDLA